MISGGLLIRTNLKYLQSYPLCFVIYFLGVSGTIAFSSLVVGLQSVDFGAYFPLCTTLGIALANVVLRISTIFFSPFRAFGNTIARTNINIFGRRATSSTNQNYHQLETIAIDEEANSTIFSESAN